MQHFLVFFTWKVDLQRERCKTSFAFLSLYEGHSCREAEKWEDRESYMWKKSSVGNQTEGVVVIWQSTLKGHDIVLEKKLKLRFFIFMILMR